MNTGTMIAARHNARVDAVAFIANRMQRRTDEVDALVAAMRASASNRAYRWPGGVWALQRCPAPRLPGESDRDYLARASHRRAHPTAPRWTALVVRRAAWQGRVWFVDLDTVEATL